MLGVGCLVDDAILHDQPRPTMTAGLAQNSWAISDTGDFRGEASSLLLIRLHTGHSLRRRLRESDKVVVFVTVSGVRWGAAITLRAYAKLHVLVTSAERANVETLH